MVRGVLNAAYQSAAWVLPPPAGSTPLQLPVPAWFPGECGGSFSRPRRRARFTLQSLERAERSGAERPRFSSLFRAHDARRLDPGRVSERASERARASSAPFCSSSPRAPSGVPRVAAADYAFISRLRVSLPPPVTSLRTITRPVRFHSDERARTVACLMSLRQAFGFRRKALGPQLPLYPAPWWLVGRASTCSRVPS